MEPHLYRAARVVISITVHIFPANCPLGTSSKLLSLRNKAVLVEPSAAQIRSKCFRASLILTGNGRLTRCCHRAL